ncbi:hypothetical protein [Arthrobacter sp. CAN_C5]|uniref:hypothetical protein n=1 Tax=Arthrobacter sp. CAN_C5 TaxID=2760706 RepID=UPI001AE5E5D3|nr:hypothetical protein [Arthrobacter sp. CAN_C5]MBP2216973.1 ABC-type methionine transport system permease subunit [Arthrobacter sp. CAN_C5]
MPTNSVDGFTTLSVPVIDQTAPTGCFGAGNLGVTSILNTIVDDEPDVHRLGPPLPD